MRGRDGPGPPMSGSCRGLIQYRVSCMTTPRSIIVNREITRYYDVTSRCVRRAHLCGEGKEHRKEWLEARLEELAGIFALDVCGYAVMDNHLHLLVRLSDGTREQAWSPMEVSHRWARLFPRRFLQDNEKGSTDPLIEARANNEGWVSMARSRLSNLGWFMKCLKEPVARMANREDDCTGAFWEGRYRSVAILDEASLVARCVYIDLNPLAAGLAEFPEDSKHTSIRTRVMHAQRATSKKSAIGNNEERATGHWLCPLGGSPGVGDEGILEGLDLRGYLGVVDWMARVKRPGKGSMESSAPSILERIGIAAEQLVRRVEFLRTKARGKWIGTVAGSAESARAAAKLRGAPWVKNLWGAHT